MLVCGERRSLPYLLLLQTPLVLNLKRLHVIMQSHVDGDVLEFPFILISKRSYQVTSHVLWRRFLNFFFSISARLARYASQQLFVSFLRPRQSRETKLTLS